MNFRPRLLSLLLRHLLGRPHSRYAPSAAYASAGKPDLASGGVPDGRHSSARAFETSPSAYPKRPRWAARATQAAAWLLGFALAVAYLFWFFKHLFFNTIR